jgi:hypothetical protein
MMRIEFTYDPADLGEIWVPDEFAANPTKAHRAWTDELAVKSVGIIVFIVFCIERVQQRAPGLSWSHPFSQVWRAFTPSVLLATLPALLPALSIIAMYAAEIAATWRTQRSRKSASRWAAELPGMTFLACVGIAIWAIFTEFQPQPTELLPQVVFLAALSSCGLLTLVLVLSFVQRRARNIGLWGKDPSLRRIKMVVIDEHAFTFGDPLYEVRFTWPAIGRVRETKNLLILISEDGTPFPIPKRAFADPADLGRCRSLLQNVVPNTQFLVRPVGFAVLPPPVPSLLEISVEASAPPELTPSQEPGTMQSEIEMEPRQ